MTNTISQHDKTNKNPVAASSTTCKASATQSTIYAQKSSACGLIAKLATIITGVEISLLFCGLSIRISETKMQNVAFKGALQSAQLQHLSKGKFGFAAVL
jgi:hypothetical protein